jgi:tRNA modification GTPase
MQNTAGQETLQQDSIVALASGALPAGVAVLRISGPAAGPVLRSLTGKGLPPARKLTLCVLRETEGAEMLDCGLIAWFPGPASFTGEDVAELHLHGGPAVVSGVLDAILRAGLSLSLPCRLAEPGEFTRRAFENERLDLVEVEALSDLVRAETAAQRRQALSAAGGSAHAMFADWRAMLQTALSYIEASIDFADEDLPEALEQAAAAAVTGVLSEVRAELGKADAGIRLRQGYLIAIVGPPNAGKSSLLNALAGREAAIVSSIPGTTRDIVEVSMDLGGYPVTLADTAGLREAADAVEAEGVRRARGLAERADLTVLVLDSMSWPDVPDALDDVSAEADIRVWSKADIGPAALSGDGVGILAVSAKTGDGIDSLLAALLDRARQDLAAGEAAVVTRRRHRESLEAVQELLSEWSATLEPEIQAHLIHQANRGLSKILGRSDIEDVLDLIFREFCIGK